jgi:hypothetical protein
LLSLHDSPAPAKPRSVVALRITNTSVLLSWLAPTMTNGVLAKYQINVQQEPETNGIQPDVHYVYPSDAAVDSDTIEYTINGLGEYLQSIFKRATLN